MILSAGCGKSNKSKSKNRKKVAKDNSAEANEDVEDTDSLYAPDGSKNSSSQNTNTSPDSDVDFEFVQDLEYLPVQVKHVTETFYPRELTEADYVTEKDLLGKETVRCLVPCVTYYYDRLVIEGDEYKELQEAFDAMQDPAIEKVLSDYNAEVERLKNLDPSEYEEGKEKRISSHLTLYRADSQIIGYELDGNRYAYSVELKRNLKLSDVVKDIDKFEDVFIKDAELCLDIDAMTVEEQDKVLDELREQIKNDTLPLYIDYDTITIHLDVSRYDAFWMDDLLYLAVGNYPLFNMDWFAHTPKYYAIGLEQFFDSVLIWDCDGDGVMEDVKLEKSEFLINDKYKAVFHYKGQVLTLQNDHSYGFFSYVVTDDGRYFYIGNCCVKLEDDGSLTLLREDSPEFCMLDDCQNPECFTVTESFDLIGTRSFKRDYTLMGNNGMPKALTLYYTDEASSLVSSTYLTAVLFDTDTGKAGDEIVIPAGSTYDISEFDPDNNTILFHITQTGEDGNAQEYYAKVNISYYTDPKGEKPDELLLSEIPANKLFNGIS